jgi:hypothetical protein
MKQSIKESIELKEKLEAEKKRKEKEYAEQLLQQSRIIVKNLEVIHFIFPFCFFSHRNKKNKKRRYSS